MSRLENYDSFVNVEALLTMDIEPSNLNHLYKELAEEVGIENCIAIYKLFRGSQQHFPVRFFSQEYTHECIRKEYTEKQTSPAKLASKYQLSERTVKRILKSSNK